MIEAATSRIAEACLEAPLQADPWTHVSEAIGSAFPGHGVFVSLAPGWSPMGPTFFAGVDPRDVEGVVRHYHRNNPWAPITHLFPEGYFGLGYETFSPAELRKRTFYNEFMQPSGFGSHVVFGGFASRREGSDELLLAVFSPTGTNDVDAQYVRLGRGILGFLKRTFRVLERLEGLAVEGTEGRAVGDWSSRALDQLRFGVLVVDANRRVLHANRAAEEILTTRRGLRRRGPRIALEDGADDRRLGELIALAASNVTSQGGAIRVNQLEREELVHVVVVPHPGCGPTPNRALLLLIPGSVPVELPKMLLRNAWGLTPAEASLMVELSNRLDLREAAESEKISYQSARTYFKRAAEKLGVRTQAGAIRTVHQICVVRER